MKKGKKGKQHAENRRTELNMLQLFEHEGQKLVAATKEKHQKARGEEQNKKK